MINSFLYQLSNLFTVTAGNYERIKPKSSCYLEKACQHVCTARQDAELEKENTEETECETYRHDDSFNVKWISLSCEVENPKWIICLTIWSRSKIYHTEWVFHFFFQFFLLHLKLWVVSLLNTKENRSNKFSKKHMRPHLTGCTKNTNQISHAFNRSVIYIALWCYLHSTGINKRKFIKNYISYMFAWCTHTFTDSLLIFSDKIISFDYYTSFHEKEKRHTFDYCIDYHTGL